MSVEVTTPGEGNAGSQVFKGETEQELVGKLATAQSHASRLIRRQSQLITRMEEIVSKLLTELLILKCRKITPQNVAKIAAKVKELIE